MLDGLDRVDWKALQHANGAAADVPDMIRDMASSDPEVRQRAFFDAYENIWQQGTVYAATAAAVPFLIEIARAPTLADRSSVLELLFHLAHGSGRDWAQAAANAVAQGRQTYVNLLHDPDSAVRRHAARMLICCPDHRAEVVPVLVTTVSADADRGVRATALYAVAVLAAHEQRPLLEGGLADPEALVRLAAALASSSLLGEAPSSKVVDLLVDFLERADSVPYDELLFGEDCASDIGLALTRVEGARRVELADRVLDVAEAGRAPSMTVAEPLLQLAFDGPQPGLTIASMNGTQRRALMFVATRAWGLRDGTWSTFVNFVYLLREYGLEAEGQKMAGYDPA